MSDSISNAPLILTLTLDAAAQGFFEELRQRHFPRERNFLAAHLTLFHHLPGPDYAAVSNHLAQVAADQPPMLLAVTGVRFLGRGVAYTLVCPALQSLHRGLQQHWVAYLTPQDQQRLNPHVTVQNKVDPAVARALHAELAADFQPFEATGTGLHLWSYRNGPWESRQEFPFEGAEAKQDA